MGTRYQPTRCTMNIDSYVVSHIFEETANCRQFVCSAYCERVDRRAELTKGGQMDDMSRLVFLKQSSRRLKVSVFFFSALALHMVAADIPKICILAAHKMPGLVLASTKKGIGRLIFDNVL